MTINYSQDTDSFGWDFQGAQNWNSIVASVPSKTAQSFEADLFEQWLKADRPDRFIVDRTGKILWSGIGAEPIPNARPSDSPFAKIKVGGTLASDMFLPILNAGSLAEPGSDRIASVDHGCTGPSFVVRVAALGPTTSGPLGVTSVTYQGLSDAVRADLKRLWDLSSGEIRILGLTFQGLTVQEVSEAADISIETVRTHIRHIYSKVGVNSREGLFAALGPVIR
jgi:DNA-binding CsgD family transcriptional regulator